MSTQVHCQFKHIPSKRDGEQLATNIETFVQPKVFDKKGIKNCGEGGNDTIQFTLTREEANRVRDKLAQVLPNESSPIWFNILSDPIDSLGLRSLQTTDDSRHQGAAFAASCQFGSLRSYSLFYSHVPLDNQIVKVSFQPARQEANTLVIEFDQYRIVIPFDSIQKKNILVNKQIEKSGVFILLPLRYVPHIYRLEPVESNGKGNQKFDMKQVRLCADERNVEFLRDIANCSDLVLHIQQSQNMAWAFLQYFLEDRPYRYEINFSNFKILNWSIENKKKPKPDPFDYKNASTQDRYALQMLISLGFVFRDKWTELINQINWNTWDPKDRYFRCRFAVEQLCIDHGYDLTRTEGDYIEARKKAKKSGKDIDEQAILAQNTQLLKIAVCTLTPLRTIFQPMEVTIGSRALRNAEFGGAERFLLVHFREENNGRLNVTNRNIKQRLRNAMSKGIDLMDQNFKYMGASTGQMKEMAFWFIDLPPEIKSITEAHRRLGDFDRIKNIATYIARVGQYFSRTRPIGIKLTEVNDVSDIRRNSGITYVARIPDIDKGPYCFTDGIGKISWGLAGRIAQKMNLPLSDKKDIPSAYQVRVAGCKGMVAIDPDSSLDDYYILVRKSMVKFESDDWNLEICDYARPMTLTLNNQVIRLLSDLGNHDDAFIAFQNRGFTQWEVPEEQQLTAIEIAVQKNLSYSSSKDNLLTNRIPIPPTDGRNMFGVADETGVLKYGECFIQYSSFSQTNDGRQKLHVLTGDVLVTKNPCLWPGDFRRLKAVRNSKLEECMRDVIVFPTTGVRPHSNEISGSDLDGDQYWVYWGDHLKIRENVAALSYEGAKKKDVPIIDQEKIITHIVESFGAGIILGMIANTHTVVADKHPEHSFSEPCKQLAELFALAVDSPKTGIFIQKDQLRPFQQKYCDTWPGYMRKFAQPTSNSTSVLEQLYSKAVIKYRQLDGRMLDSTFPQRKEDASACKIVDEAFKKWFNEGTYEESSDEKGPPRLKPVKTVNDEAKAKSKATAASNSKTSTIDENPSQETNKPGKKRPETPKVTKNESDKKQSGKTSATSKIESSDTKTSNKLMNSDPMPSAASSLASSAASLPPITSDQYSLDFQMMSDPAITAAGNVEFPEASGNWHTVWPEKDIATVPDREVILNKLTSYMEKQSVLKRTSPASNEALYGKLYLMVFYGHIYFAKLDSQKLSALQKLIIEKGDSIIRFNYADINELNIPNASSSKTKKNTFEYELDCQLNSSSSEYITLLFDKNKVLCQICVYRVWSRSYIRLPNYTIDNLYEIRSVITHDSDSLEFKTISESIFSAKSKDIFTGRKPNIKIDRNFLHRSVILISLKVIDEDQQTNISQERIEAFHRKVKYVSLNEGQDKPKVSATLEYHVTPINSKTKDVLDEICTLASSPIDEPAQNGKSAKSSNPSNKPNSLCGFSMSDT